MKSYVIYHREKVDGHEWRMTRRRVSNAFLLFMRNVFRQRENTERPSTMVLVSSCVSFRIRLNNNNG